MTTTDDELDDRAGPADRASALAALLDLVDELGQHDPDELTLAARALLEHFDRRELLDAEDTRRLIGIGHATYARRLDALRFASNVTSSMLWQDLDRDEIEAAFGRLEHIAELVLGFVEGDRR